MHISTDKNRYTSVYPGGYPGLSNKTHLVEMPFSFALYNENGIISANRVFYL